MPRSYELPNQRQQQQQRPPPPSYDFVLYSQQDTYLDLLSQDASTYPNSYAVEPATHRPSHALTHSASDSGSPTLASLSADDHLFFVSSHSPSTQSAFAEALADGQRSVSTLEQQQQPPPLPASTGSWMSGPSITSTSPSTQGSPCSGTSQMLPRSDPWLSTDMTGLGIISGPGIVHSEVIDYESLLHTGLGPDMNFADDKSPTGFVGKCVTVVFFVVR